MANILVVEDESIVGLDIQTRLQRLGYDVPEVVASGEEALVQVEALKPDLVLMDIMLEGEMDGIQTADLVRGRYDIPVVFLTAYSDESTLDRAKITSPYGYLLKPFKDRELYTTIEMGFCKHQVEKKLRYAHDELEQRVQERTAELARVNEELKLEIEERKRADEQKTGLEAQLRQSQKMEALGRLAGGIAHDFNNMLTIITGYSELVLDDMSEEDPRYRDIKTVQDAGNRAATLTSQLLAFGRRQMLNYQSLDLNQAVSSIYDMLVRLIGEDIELLADLQPDLHCVKTDPGQFDQVLINLAINARDAMLRGGKLFIETSDVELDEAHTRRHVNVTPGFYVRLRVRDTGCGMSEKIRSRIFEPFFTTKPKGESTGLGLSVVYGIVEQSGGHIDVASKSGKGTTFDIYLPQTGRVSEVQKEQQTRPSFREGAESILLVEDEEEVLKLTRRILLDHGFHVLEARKGEDALVLSELHEGRIHLLLTDVVMPEMSGRQLAERLTPLRPDMKVLYMSGYTDDTVLRYGIQEKEMPFLQKPFSPEALIGKVWQALNQ